jgi:hypothetical protein
MPPETMLRPVTESRHAKAMDQDDEDQLLYEQFAGRAGNWELNQKPRPFHFPGRLIAGVFYNLVCWSSAGVIAYTFFKFYQTKEQYWMLYALGAFATFLVFMVARYSNGLNTKCPLCHGTPLHEKRCHKHRFANKFLFFGHRTSTVLSILTRGKFNCMYCGTPFRLKK